MNLILSLIALSGLVAMAALERHFQHHRSRDFVTVAVGFGTLAMAAVMRTIEAAGAFAGLPLLQNELAFDTMIWSANLLGLILVVSGISQWLPLMREFRNIRSERLSQLELIKMAHQLSSLETRPHRLFPRFIQQLTASLDLDGVALLRRDSDGCQLVAAQGCASGLAPTLEQIEPGDAAWCGGLISDTWRPNAVASVLAVPMSPSNGEEYLFLLWAHGEPFDSDLRQNIKIAVEIVSQAIRTESDGSPEGHGVEIRDHSALRELLDATIDVPQLCRRFGKLFMGHRGVKYLSIETINGDRVERYSIGITGKVLTQTGLDSSALPPNTITVLDSMEPIQVSVSRRVDPKTALEHALGSVENGSILCIPASVGGRSAVLTLASDKSHAFVAMALSEIHMIAASLAATLARQQTEDMVTRDAGRLASTATTVESLSAASSLSESFKMAAELLNQLIDPSMIRISSFGRERSFLTSRALLTEDDLEVPTPAGGHMVLSLMPYHKMVLEHGRLMLINQNDTERPITEGEARQAWCPDLKSALIVPITVNGQVVSVLSMADRRPWEQFRFDQNDIAMAGMVSSLLSMAIRANVMTQRPGRVRFEAEPKRSSRTVELPGIVDRQTQSLFTQAP